MRLFFAAGLLKWLGDDLSFPGLITILVLQT